MFKDDDGCYNIIDFKTSSMYKGKTLEEHSGQLTIYGLGLVQAGIPLDKVKICFNFLKYCNVQYHQKNGAVKERQVERYKLGDSLKTNVKMWLKADGYSEDEVDNYLKLLIDTNSLDVLPDDVRDKYVITDCHVFIPFTQELIDKWTDTIVSTIQDINMREKDYEETKSDAAFWDSEEDVKAQSYYFSTLMGYSANLHKPYKKFLDKLEAQKNDTDIFGGLVGDSKNDVATSQDICNNKTDEVDLSWLDELA